MLKAVVFDMDGVIVDSHPIHKRAWKKFLAGLGKDVSDSDLEFVLDGRKKEEILRHFLGELTAEQVRRYASEKELLFREEMSLVGPLPGLPRLLDELRLGRVHIAVASCGSRLRVDYLLDHLQLQRSFRTVVTGDDVPNGKPDPAIFLEAVRRLQVRCAEVLVVEDAVSGVKAAKSAGMKCLAVASNGRESLLRVAGADCVVADFVDISLRKLQGLFPG